MIILAVFRISCLADGSAQDYLECLEPIEM